MSFTSRDFAKVQKAIEKDQFVSKRLSDRMIKVYKPTGEAVEFSETIVAIANLLASQGFDPKSAPAQVIQSVAFTLANNQVTNAKRFFPVENEIRPERGAEKAESNGDGETPEPKARRARRKASADADKPARARKPARKPAEASEAPEASAPRRRGRARRTESPATPPVLPKARRSRRALNGEHNGEAKQARRGRKPSSSVVEYSVPMWTGLVSNCVVIRELIQRLDKTPRRDERLGHLEALLDSITNEKESGTLQFPVTQPEEAGTPSQG